MLLDASVAILLVITLVVVSAVDRHAAAPAPRAPRLAPELTAAATATEPAPPPPPPPQIPIPTETAPEPDPEPPQLSDLAAGLTPTQPVDTKPVVNVRFTRDARFGLQALQGNPDDPTDDFKKLTYELDGGTNNTRVSVDGATPLFGSSLGQLVEDLNVDSQGRHRYAWAFRQVEFEQVVELVPGELSQRLDTIQVTYTARNDGKAPRRVGLRVMLDTLIGNNDGVPFIVPGRPRIVEAPQSYHGDGVPDFIRALETGNLASPGVIVSIGLHPDVGEQPAEVVLSHWPGSDANWDYDRNAPFGHDTAVGLYYDPRPLPPGETRTIRFTYGLGTISSTTTKNARLSLTSGGLLQAGGKFWVVALVQNPKAGQFVTLALPEGLSFRSSAEARKPVPEARGFTQVGWLVTAEPGCVGDVEVSATLEPENIRERQVLHLQPRHARLRLLARGPFASGRPFWVVAVVQHPRAGQTISLELPDGLALGAGETASKSVPQDGEHAQVRWLVTADRGTAGARELKVRLEPEGLEERQPLVIEPRAPRLTVAAQGPFRAGERFWVSALVEQPRDGQIVELTLPAGLALERGETPRKELKPSADACQVNWLVRARPDAVGKQAIAVSLLPAGLARTTEIHVEAGNLIH